MCALPPPRASLGAWGRRSEPSISGRAQTERAPLETEGLKLPKRRKAAFPHTLPQ